MAVPAHGAIEVAAGALLDGFVDLSYAYRFGPPPADLVVATLRGAGVEVLAEAFHFPAGRPARRELDVGLAAEAAACADGDADLTVTDPALRPGRRRSSWPGSPPTTTTSTSRRTGPGPSGSTPVPGAPARSPRRGAAVASTPRPPARFQVSP